MSAVSEGHSFVAQVSIASIVLGSVGRADAQPAFVQVAYSVPQTPQATVTVTRRANCRKPERGNDQVGRRHVAGDGSQRYER